MVHRKPGTKNRAIILFNFMFRFIWIFALIGCEIRNAPVEFERIPLPEGGSISQLATLEKEGGENEIFALASEKVFRRGEDGWRQVSEKKPFINEGTTLVGLGQYLYAFSPATFNRVNVLFRSKDGVVWDEVLLPRKIRSMRFRKAKGKIRTKSFRVLDDVHLRVSESSLLLVHAQNIWKAKLRASTLTWQALNLDGLPFGVKRDSKLPPSIRNYLPTSPSRSFEMVTLLSEQLLIFRREKGEQSWALVSSLPEADLGLVGVPKEETIFLVAENTIHRSDDQGDEWFQFKPAEKISIHSFLVAPRGDGFTMLLGTQRGAVWRSADGENWKQSFAADQDNRKVSRFLALGENIFVATQGRGIFLSENGGRTFSQDNDGLSASVPNDILLFNKRPVISTEAGIFRWNKKKWENWSPRNTTVLKTFQNQMIAGTQNGDILSGDFSQGPSVFKPQFAKTSVHFDPAEIGSTDLTITHISSDSKGRVIAWSKNSGAISNLGQSANWEVFPLVEAFESLLNRGAIVDFGIAANAFFVVEKSDSMFRLWRSDAQATSWKEVSRFESTKVALGASSRTSESLVLIEDGKLNLTSDGGSSWVEMKGPWQAYDVVGSRSFEKNKLGVLVRTSRRLEFYVLDRISKTPTFQSHPLLGTKEIDENVLFSVEKDRILLATKNAVYLGEIKGESDGFSFGSSMFMTGILSLLFAALAFIFVRIFVAAKTVGL